MAKLPLLRHPIKSNDLKKIIEANGFTTQGRNGLGSTHLRYRRGKYVFIFTNKGGGRESSPAQVKEFQKILDKIKQDDLSNSSSSLQK